MRMDRVEPILAARDLEEVRAFYRRLGFEAWFKGRGGWEYEIIWSGGTW